jgi:hypothetical protein
MEKMWNELALDICLEEISKTIKNVSQKSRCPCRVSNGAFPESDANISGANSGI